MVLLLAFSPHFAVFPGCIIPCFAGLMVYSLRVFTWCICASPHMLHPSLPQDKEPRGIIPLENLSIREVEEPRKPVSVASLETSPSDHTPSSSPLRSTLFMFQYNYPAVAHCWCPAVCLCSRIVLSSITPITKARLSKPARRRQMGVLLRATMWCIEYQRPRRKRKRSGLNPSSKTPHINLFIFHHILLFLHSL